MRDLEFRRHQKDKKKNKANRVSRQWYESSDYSQYAVDEAAKLMEKYADHLKMCSCEMCKNDKYDRKSEKKHFDRILNEL